MEQPHKITKTQREKKKKRIQTSINLSYHHYESIQIKENTKCLHLKTLLQEGRKKVTEWKKKLKTKLHHFASF